jgi:hypothetical protein
VSPAPWPRAGREDHARFCEREGWRAGNAFELDLPDGRILRTRVSHPPGRTVYGPIIWAHILRDQLGVSEDEFWACVKEGVKPGRGAPDIPAQALPADLVHLLVSKVGVAEAEIAAMTKETAVARLQDYWMAES